MKLNKKALAANRKLVPQPSDPKSSMQKTR